MTEEKKETSEVAPAGAARIAELEAEVERLKRENRALLGKKKMLTTSMVEAPPMISPRKNLMISTTQPRPHPIGGKPPMLQTHNIQPKELDAAGILDRVKKARAADAKKEIKTK